MTMRFYAACLASYNNGVLHGRWIDASSDVDEMQEAVSAMLCASRFPNVTVECPDCEGSGNAPHDRAPGVGPVCPTCKGKGEVPSAEEWAVHDTDGLPDMGEYPGLQAIADYVEFIEQVESETGLDEDQARALAKAMLDNWHDVDSAKGELENFAGIHDSFRDYADEIADEMMPTDAPEMLTRYFDYESFARDLALEMTVLDVPGGVAVFHG